MPSCKWLFLNNLRSKTLGQIQNLVPHRLMSRLKSNNPDVNRSIAEYDGDGGRPEFGLRGQRRGTESDKGTVANSLSGQGKIAAQQIRHGTADKPTAKRQVMNNSARTAFRAGTAGSKFQPDRCAGSKENSRGETDSPNKQWVHAVKNS